jgi:prephenate dehydrogenase
MPEKLKVGIVGLGLIGGSIEKRLGLKPDLYEVKAVSVSQERLFTLADLKEEDIVFICSPQSKVRSVLDQIALMQSKDENAFQRTIITDVASTKSKIKHEAELLGLKNFVAGHPMAGTEKQGYDAAFPELFEGAKWILDSSSGEYPILEKLIKEELGAVIEYLDAEVHDQAVAVTSHLPLVLSVALAKLGIDFPVSKKTIGPGFKGMVRLAQGNVAMGKEIIDLNRHNIKEFWADYKAQVDALLDANEDDLEQELTKTKEKLQV